MITKNCKMILTAIAVLAILVIPSAIVNDDSGAGSGIVPYGDEVTGAKLISFDDNGGTGGYSQFVLTGSQYYFPSEYRDNVSRSGYVLMSWETSAHTDKRYPGDVDTAVDNETYFANWQSTSYNSTPRIIGVAKEHILTAGHSIQYYENYENYYVEDNEVNDWIRESIYSIYPFKFVYTVTCNGVRSVSEITTRSGVTTLRGLTLDINDGSIHIYGNPDAPGVYEISVNLLTKQGGRTEGYYGNRDDIIVRWYLSAIDNEHDASEMYHVWYGTEYDRSGPYGTAVKLPDAKDTDVTALLGWTVKVGMTQSVYAIGSSYTIRDGNIRLERSELTYEQIIASGKIGLVAYNANGGYYKGEFAQLVPTDGYVSLFSGNIVTKSGYTFIGWNESGDPSEPIYPANYVYPIEEKYNELKAVWVQDSYLLGTVRMTFTDPIGGTDTIYTVQRGFTYYAPSLLFDHGSYELVGFTTDGSHDYKDTNEANYPEDTSISVRPLSNTKYYPVYQLKAYEYNITFWPNGADGGKGQMKVTSTDNPIDIILPSSDEYGFIYEGYNFAGWSEDRYASVGEYKAGLPITLSDLKQSAVLFAIWTEEIVTERNTFFIVYNPNGSEVTGTPAIQYYVTDDREWETKLSKSAPLRYGYDFKGWATSPDGEPQYRTGALVSMTLSEVERTRTLNLYAVWEVSSEPLEQRAFVQFVDERGYFLTKNVIVGNKITSPDPLKKDRYAFKGWYRGTEAWDFDSPVMEDMTLKAKYIEVFSIEVDGKSVRITMLAPYTDGKITFSDGTQIQLTYETSYVHDVDRSGTVKVEINNADGSYTATSGFEKGAEPSVSEDNTILIVTYAGIGTVALLGVIFIIRRFIL